MASVVPDPPASDGALGDRPLRRRSRAFLALLLGWLALDQVTKALISAHFARPDAGRQVELLPWLDLTLTHNPGAAFGLLNQVEWARYLFIVIAVAALGLLVWHRRGIMLLPVWERVGLALVGAGAAGNLVDRVFRGGYVVDFIHFHLDSIGYAYPDFNVADIGVTCGITLYVVHALLADARRARLERAPGERAAAGDG